MDSRSEEGHEGCALDYEECACTIVQYILVSNIWPLQSLVHTVCKEECTRKSIPDNPFPNTAKELNHSTKEDKHGAVCICELLVSFWPYMKKGERIILTQWQLPGHQHPSIPSWYKHSKSRRSRNQARRSGWDCPVSCEDLRRLVGSWDWGRVFQRPRGR